MGDRARLRGFALGAGAGTAIVVAASAAFVAVQGALAHNEATAPAPTASPQTTEVETGPVQRTVSGDVAAAEEATVSVAGPREDGSRVITRTGAAVGANVQSGQVIATVNERPAILLQSEVPFYRILSAGFAGRDVEALQRSLQALGYGLANDRSGTYGAGTAQAVFFLYRDRAYEPVDANGQKVDIQSASTAAVPLGEIIAAPATPMVPVESCGVVGTVISEQVCGLRAAEGAAQVSVPKSEAAAVGSGQQVIIRTDDGDDVAATIGERVAVPPGPTPAAGNDAAVDGSTPANDAVAFRLVMAEPWDPRRSGSALIVIAASDEADLRVPEIAIRRAGNATWLVADTGAKLPVAAGLCADGLCTIKGDGIASGQNVRLPRVSK